MSVRIQRWSLRPSQAESPRLAWAFVISLAVHLLLFGGYRAEQQLGWLRKLHLPAWMQSVKLLDNFFKKPALPLLQPPKPQEAPLMFVEVSPAQATVEPPKNANFYSDKNSTAANPKADQDTGVPLIAGKQNQMVKTEDVPRVEPFPLQPVPPQPQPQPQPPAPAVEELKPKPVQTPGDLTVAKSEPIPHTEPGNAEIPRPARPRTLEDARARLQDNRLPGEKMKQEGGVRRHVDIASLDAQATPLGAYDWILVQAVSQRWYALLDERQYASDDRGKVVIRFSLHYDGTITGISIAENTTSEVLGYVCVRAIEEPAPYTPWPADLRNAISSGKRDIQFTFFYN